MTTRDGRAPETFVQRGFRNARQFVRFALVGGSGVVVNLIVAVILNKLHGGTAHAFDIIWHIPGTRYNIRFTVVVWLVAFVVANIWNFELNRRWTFRSARPRGWFSEFWPFLAVGSVAAFLGIFLKVGFTNPHSPIYLSSSFFHEGSGLHSREYWAQIITILITMPINFVVNKLWTFRAVRHHRHEGTERPTAPTAQRSVATASSVSDNER